MFICFLYFRFSIIKRILFQCIAYLFKVQEMSLLTGDWYNGVGFPVTWTFVMFSGSVDNCHWLSVSVNMVMAKGGSYMQNESVKAA